MEVPRKIACVYVACLRFIHRLLKQQILESRLGHVSFDERRHKLATLAVESFGCLGVEGSNLINQLADRVVGGRDGGSMARKGVVNYVSSL